MKLIEYLVNRMGDELNDADGYAEQALLLKATYPRLSDTLAKIADQECAHYTMLHEQAALIITDYRQKNGEPPAAMMAVYEHEHKKAIEHMAKTKVKIGMLKTT